MIGVYGIVNTVTGRMYIGSSKDIYTRLRKHRARLRIGKHHTPHLQYAWNKYGEDVFQFTTIRELLSENDLADAEKSEVEKRWPFVYNSSRNTDSPRRGMKNSPEHNAAISAWSTGRETTPDVRAAISQANKGRIITAEWRQRISDGLKLRPRNEKNIQRIIDLNKSRTGYRHSEASKAKMGLAKKGHSLPKSQETKAKMSVAKKQWWARRKAEQAS